MHAPAVSVLIPTHNMEAHLRIALASILDGHFEPLEVIVIDDGSTDATAAALRAFTTPGAQRYDRRVRTLWQSHRGKSAAVNNGIRAARGTYLTIVDADDRLPPDSLTRRYQRATAGTGAACVAGAFAIIDAEGQELGRRPVPAARDPHRLLQRFFVAPHTPLHLNTCLLHRELVATVGALDERLARGEDVEYLFRVLKHIDHVPVVDAPVYHYRKHRRTLSERLRVRWVTGRCRQEIYRRHAPEGWGPLATGAAVALDLGKMCYELVKGYYPS
ncbi:glycosyltransferase family 2 protein [Salisaeta longa]|uniref:glycosyltransferase family 2 protein n=1 Tax=Salisaeta longa TaxID=503170 RepID=UPI0003B58BB8|nr:glycosyltransferase family 2 protein [Salisaeta longa]